MPPPIRIAIIGLGKIARDQHLPAIGRSGDFEAVLAVDPAGGGAGGVPVFSSLDAALASDIRLDAAAICTPPQARPALCRQLTEQGCAVLLEKPPASSLAEAGTIAALAGAGRPVIFAAWHSRYAPHMEAARAWAAAHELVSGEIEWRENPAKWHPGQTWLWREDGFGVFDPGINALSILTGIYPRDWQVGDASLRIPSNAAAPAAADFNLSASGATIRTRFEFHDSNTEVWAIRLRASNGDTLELSDGGAAIAENGGPARRGVEAEYDGIYEEFASLIRSGQSDVDLAPLRITEDVFSGAERIASAPLRF